MSKALINDTKNDTNQESVMQSEIEASPSFDIRRS